MAVFTPELLIKATPRRERAKLPKRTKFGWEVYSSNNAVLGAQARLDINLGWSLDFPEGMMGNLVSHRTLLECRGISVCETVWTGGDVVLQLINHTGEVYQIKIGDAVAYLILVPIQLARMEEETFYEVVRDGSSSSGSSGPRRMHGPRRTDECN